MESRMEPSAQVERFQKAIRTALIGPPELSQRDLCAKIGVSIGSLSKYLRGEVEPGKVGLDIQAKLAEVLGHSMDALNRYYMTGEWTSDTSIKTVLSWIRSDAGQEDLPAILESMQAMTTRTSVTDQGSDSDSKDYLWPLQELKAASVSDKMRKKLGLTDKALWDLAKEGKFDDDLIEAFSLACDYAEDAVREAFTKREPITA